MNYTLRFLHPAEQLISITLETYCPGKSLCLHLPRWRPGRYELQPYARNLSDLQACDAKQQVLEVQKTDSHTWEVQVSKPGPVQISYRYYANQLDAGGSFFDASTIYVNPINLLLFDELCLSQPCTLHLELPEGYQHSLLPQNEAGGFAFENFHQLVDSPFVAAPALIHHLFQIEGIPTHLWFLGDCQPDLERIEADIQAYSQAQLALFQDFPVSYYQYLYVMHPSRFRHGVEHADSTVIVMGPGHKLMQTEMYGSLLEISSHELFHTWNVKALRPRDLLPYDYRRENYSRLHYVTEGITTYYGDLMLWKGGVWKLENWIQSINGELKTHYQMGGKDSISLAAASFDSWVNGYQQEGFPNRRISFYTKGFLVAMLMDLTIRKATQNQRSLDDVMYALYHDFAPVNKGYTDADIQHYLERFSGEDFTDFFAKYIAGTEALEPALHTLADYMGFQLLSLPPQSPLAHRWGMKVNYLGGGSAMIEKLLPESPVQAAGLHPGDEIISVEGRQVRHNLEEWLVYFQDQSDLQVHYFHQGRMREAVIEHRIHEAYHVPQFMPQLSPSASQRENLRAWQRVGSGRQAAIIS